MPVISFNEFQKRKLNYKYLKKVDYCKKKLLKLFPDLADAKEYQFVNYRILSVDFEVAKKNSYNKEAYCDIDKKIIYLNHSVLDASVQQLTKVILHELIHLNYPNLKELEVIKETNSRMSKLFSLDNIDFR